MESSENEKKPKRPRIGQATRPMGDSSDFSRYEKVNYGKPAADGDQPAGSEDAPRYQRPYSPRQNSYNNNRQGGYYNHNNGGGYNNYRSNGGYQPRPRPEYQSTDSSTAAEGASEGETQHSSQPSYPRYNSYNPNFNRNNYNRNGHSIYNNGQQRQGG